MIPTWNNKLWIDSLICSKSALKSSWLIPLFFVHFCTFAVSQGSIYFQQYRMANPRHDDMSIVLSVGIFGILIFMVLSLLWLMWSARLAYDFKKNTNLKQALDYNQTAIEYMRSLVSSLCYGLLFIVPGLVQFVRLSFASHISMFDGNYNEGKVDALAKSKQMMKGRVLTLLFILAIKIILSLGIESVLTMHGTLIDENPMGVMLNQIIQLFINLVFSVYLSLLFFEILELQTPLKFNNSQQNFKS